MATTIRTPTKADFFTTPYVKSLLGRSTMERGRMQVFQQLVTAPVTDDNLAHRNAEITHLASAEEEAITIEVVSSSDDDSDKEVNVIVIDALGELITVTVELEDTDGTPEPVEIDDVVEVLGAYVTEPLVGNVTISDGDTDVYAYIPSTGADSEHSIFHCPAGKSAVLMVAKVTPLIAPIADDARIAITFEVNGTVVHADHVSSVNFPKVLEVFPILEVGPGDVVVTKVQSTAAGPKDVIIQQAWLIKDA